MCVREKESEKVIVCMKQRHTERASERISDNESFTTTHVNMTMGAAPWTAARTEEEQAISGYDASGLL